MVFWYNLVNLIIMQIMREIPNGQDAEIKEPERNQEHPQLQTAINAYLSQREDYFREIYPGSFEILLEGERKMIQSNREKGYLSNWHPGEDILVCITENIKKSVTAGSGAIELGDQISDYLPRDVIEAKKNGLIVSMNEGKTFSAEDVKCKEDEFKIFSLGQGGCDNVVLAGKEDDGNILISVLHFSPLDTAELLDALGRERNKYSGIKETKAVSFMSPDRRKEAFDALLTAIERFPSPKCEEGETDANQSTDALQDVLEITVNKKTKRIRVRMKGQVFDWQM
jgi:hypothetical protein